MDDDEVVKLAREDDQRILLNYEFGDEQFSVLAEDDTTPAGAWPEYMIALFTDWLINRAKALRPHRLLHGDLILEEHHHGVVSHISDFSVTVRYGAGPGEFEVEYPKTQFELNAWLNRGDEIEAVIGLLRAPRSSVTLDRIYSEDEQRALDAEDDKKAGVVGDLKL